VSLVREFSWVTSLPFGISININISIGISMAISTNMYVCALQGLA
jgi:hypothetical protein